MVFVVCLWCVCCVFVVVFVVCLWCSCCLWCTCCLCCPCGFFLFFYVVHVAVHSDTQYNTYCKQRATLSSNKHTTPTYKHTTHIRQNTYPTHPSKHTVTRSPLPIGLHKMTCPCTDGSIPVAVACVRTLYCSILLSSTLINTRQTSGASWV